MKAEYHLIHSLILLVILILIWLILQSIQHKLGVIIIDAPDKEKAIPDRMSGIAY